MVVTKSRGYQGIEGNTSENRNEVPDPDDTTVPQEIEMASMSVVPDGRINVILKELYSTFNQFHFRHIYCNTSCECSWFRLVSSEIVIMDWALLDGR